MELLYFAIAICTFLLPLAFLSFYRWYNQRKNKRAPFTDKFLRSPGQSLMEQIQTVSDDVNVYASTSMTAPLFIMFAANILKTNIPYYVFILAVSEVILLGKLWRSLNKRNLLRLGYDGETAVGQELNLLMLDGYRVFHDLVTDKLKKFNIDHIIVGASGVYAVETKARSKSKIKKGNDAATVVYDGKAVNFPYYSDTDSLKQARLNAVYLEKWLTGAVGETVTVEALLTIPGWFVERKAPPRGVHVLNPKQIKTFLKSKKEKPLSDSMVQRIVHQLDQKCRNVDPVTIQVENYLKDSK